MTLKYNSARTASFYNIARPKHVTIVDVLGVSLLHQISLGAGILQILSSLEQFDTTHY